MLGWRHKCKLIKPDYVGSRQFYCLTPGNKIKSWGGSILSLTVEMLSGHIDKVLLRVVRGGGHCLIGAPSFQVF